MGRQFTGKKNLFMEPKLLGLAGTIDKFTGGLSRCSPIYFERHNYYGNQRLNFHEDLEDIYFIHKEKSLGRKP